MKKRKLLWMMLMGFVGVVCAQSEVKSFKVHFKSDEYMLDQTDKELLNQLLLQMESSTYSEVVLKAHTDKDADVNYNIDLSNKRAKSVSNYLQEKGIKTHRISEYYYGESKPIKNNATESGKAENRRVDILLHYYAYSNIGELLKLIGGYKKQEFTIKPNADNTIVAKNGLTVKLPMGSLQTLDGKAISGKEVKMELEEFFKPSDAATQQLSTMADGKILETGGMFSVKVTQNGQELTLKDGKNIQVTMPSINLNKDMQVFVPVVNTLGVTEWKNTAQPFELKPKKEIKLPHTKINTNELQSFKEKTDLTNLNKLIYSYKPLSIPKRPFPPKKQKQLKDAAKNDLFPWYELIFYSNAKIAKAVEAENNKRHILNEKNQLKFEAKLATYQANLAKYKMDSAAFETSELTEFRAWLHDRETQYTEVKTELDKSNFNKGIDKFCELSEQEKITTLNPKGLLVNLSNSNPNQRWYLASIDFALNNISQLKEMSLTKALGFFGNKKGEIFIGPKGKEQFRYYGNFANNQFANLQASNNKSLATILDNAQLDIMQQREKLGLLEPGAVAQIYTASLSQFGMYNCDRFNTTPENQMAEIIIECEGEARVSFYLPEISSFIYAYHDKKKGYHLKLPIGKQARMVVLTFNKSGEPLYESKDITITGDETLVSNPKLASIFDIRKSLASL